MIKITTVLISLLILTLTACVVFRKGTIDNKMTYYKKDFISMTRYTEDDFGQFIIKFNLLPGKTVGTCNMIFNIIEIDPLYWKFASTKERGALLFHEFGHCLCRRLHDNKKRKDKCPVSLMNRYVPDHVCLTKHWTSYISDIKRRCR